MVHLKFGVLCGLSGDCGNSLMKEAPILGIIVIFPGAQVYPTVHLITIVITSSYATGTYLREYMKLYIKLSVY